MLSTGEGRDLQIRAPAAFFISYPMPRCGGMVPRADDEVRWDEVGWAYAG